ncbi:MAG: FlgD immunoglobulin-like domain containing protein, partial [Candidatus Eisenbacteria bacterium]|nr:FlgD immunoglobulin-like domain containing protein [Candidatus Eisenbacteria bacterium]
TVTGSGVFPYRGTAQVAVAQSFLAVEGWTIDDDASGQSAGNGDGALNPGETVELSLTIRNQGSANADAVTASLNALHGAEVVTGSADYGDLPAGAQGEPATPFVIRIPKDAENASAVQLQLEVTAGGQRSSTDATLNVVAPSLIHESAAYAGDGVLLPGETSDLAVTVRNDGAVGTDGFEAVLRTLDPALVAIVDSTVSYGAAAPGASITGSEAFVVEASDEAAQGQAARFTLRVTTAEGFESETSFSAMVGTANVFAPLGPDTYGYYAYDSADTDYPDTAPVYDWISCSTAYGGTGTKIMTGGNATMGDNTLKLIDLPFPFTFYREAHNQILVSDNGWVSFETTPYYDYYNWHMPTTYGNGSTIAVFWDNLDPVHTVNDRMICDGVYTFYDPDRHAFVIEWSRLANYEPDYDDLQTFELILFDPAFHPTPTGDGMFQMQYKQVKNNDNGRAFSTVGIEDPTEQIGLEYTFGNLYPTTAAPLSSGLAIRFTTQPPRYSPFRFASFRAEPAGGSGVALSWEPIDERPRAGTRIYRARPGGDFALVSGPVRLDPATRSFVDEAADPDSTYSYKVGSLDTYGRETIVGPFEYAPGASGSSHLALSLVAKTAVPFRGSCDLTYQLPRAATVQLRVHDLSGRVVRTLVSERHNAGKWDVTWDGRDDAGRDLPSGIYYCKLAAGSELRTMKLTLLR